MPTLTIDGRQISSPDGSTVIQAAEALGIFVPRYCYHPALSVAGNCRICLVDVEKSPKLQIACNTPVTEGMVVHTKSANAEDGRRAVLEFTERGGPWETEIETFGLIARHYEQPLFRYELGRSFINWQLKRSAERKGGGPSNLQMKGEREIPKSQ